MNSVIDIQSQDYLDYIALSGPDRTLRRLQSLAATLNSAAWGILDDTETTVPKDETKTDQISHDIEAIPAPLGAPPLSLIHLIGSGSDRIDPLRQVENSEQWSALFFDWINQQDWGKNLRLTEIYSQNPIPYETYTHFRQWRSLPPAKYLLPEFPNELRTANLFFRSHGDLRAVRFNNCILLMQIHDNGIANVISMLDDTLDDYSEDPELAKLLSEFKIEVAHPKN